MEPHVGHQHRAETVLENAWMAQTAETRQQKIQLFAGNTNEFFYKQTSGDLFFISFHLLFLKHFFLENTRLYS